MFARDPFEEVLHLFVVGVIDADGNALAAQSVTWSAVSWIVPEDADFPMLSVRPVMYTVYPWLPSARAMPAPAPLLAPVTTAIRFVYRHQFLSRFRCASPVRHTVVQERCVSVSTRSCKRFGQAIYSNGAAVDTDDLAGDVAGRI